MAGAFALAILVAGCSGISLEEEEAPAPAPAASVQLAGSWSGSLEVEGQRIPGTLVLRQTADRLEATFSASALGDETTGAGEIGEGGTLRIELRYRTQCPGTIELTGAILDQASRIAGTLTATDCTGPATGAFTFSRR